MALSNRQAVAMARPGAISNGGAPQAMNIQTPGWTPPGGTPGGIPPQTGGGFQAPPGFPTGGPLGAPGGLPMPPGTGGGLGAPGMTNNVDPSQNLQWLQDQYKSRLGQDPTKRAIAGATSGVRDATTGLMKELGGNMARRGIAQSGIQTSGQQALAQNAQQQIAGRTADITMGRERDIDSMVMGGLPIMGAQDELGLRKQGLGLQQWQAQNQAELAKQQLALQAQGQAQQGQRDLWSMWSQYISAMR
jgi:hypothetical protein